MIPRNPILIHSTGFTVVPRLRGPRAPLNQSTRLLVAVRNVLADSCAVFPSAHPSLQGSVILPEIFMTPSDTLRYQPQPGFGNNDQPPAVPPNTALPNSPTNK